LTLDLSGFFDYEDFTYYKKYHSSDSRWFS